MQRYEIALGTFHRPDTLPKYGAWIQDDWQISNRLTLNLGLRYDLIWNAFAQHRSFLQWMPADRPQEADNLQPRVGFAYSLNDRTVLRGGSGLYYADIPAAALNWAQLPQKVAFRPPAPIIRSRTGPGDSIRSGASSGWTRRPDGPTTTACRPR